ncbi:uracil catabolism 4 [Fusarium mundagurra]|uniref:Uracil catabolism 4 n=1 Tax=Fusarium mundagurra TaxID=1567541 RepID=A0A8H6DDD8_9HYPO|nr:uracil catabolism 4 [Fusarium mundagurra]
MGQDIALALFVNFFHILPIMSQQQESTPEALDGFSRLPMEMNIQIMMFLDPQGLLSLTGASPTVRRQFLVEYHESILKPHLKRIRKYYGHPASIPLIILLTHLRTLRARLKGKPRTELENELDPILTSVLSHDIIKMPPQWESDLLILGAATSLIPEIRHVFSTWRTRWNGSGRELREAPPRETWIFVECFLRFECFCNIAYEPQGFLFQNMFNYKNIFLQSFRMNIDFSPSDLRPWRWFRNLVKCREKRAREDIEHTFNAPRYYEEQYGKPVRSVRQFLRSELSTTTDPENEIPKTITEPQMMDFLGRTDSENEFFCYHLSLQGNTLLTYLSSLQQEALSSFIVREFSTFLASHPFCDSIYPDDLEEMRFIQENWCFE